LEVGGLGLGTVVAGAAVVVVGSTVVVVEGAVEVVEGVEGAVPCDAFVSGRTERALEGP
jgi:hypothetical protein